MFNQSLLSLPLVWHAGWAVVVGVVFCYPLSKAMLEAIEWASRPEHRLAQESAGWFFRGKFVPALWKLLVLWGLWFILALFVTWWQAKRTITFGYKPGSMNSWPGICAWITCALAPLAIAFWQAMACFALAPRFSKPSFLALASICTACLVWGFIAVAFSHSAMRGIWREYWPKIWKIKTLDGNWPEFQLTFGYVDPEILLSYYAPVLETVQGDALAPFQFLFALPPLVFALGYRWRKPNSWLRAER